MELQVPIQLWFRAVGWQAVGRQAAAWLAGGEWVGYM